MRPHTTLAGSTSGTLSQKRTHTVHGILGAAMHIVMEEGVAGLSMSALAQRAQVSRQTLYNYFPDVDAVLAGLVEMGDAGTAELGDRLAAEPDVRAALGVFAAAVVDSVAAGHPSPVALMAMLPASLREDMAAHEERAERLVVEILVRGREEGVFRPDVDPGVDGRILHRAAFAAAELAREPGADVDILVEHLSRDLLAMVAAGRPREPRR